MQRLVECVPNFSEGRRPEVLEAIADALRAHAHVQLLDIESDEDHNRSVFTLVAPPEAMVPAVFDAIKTAAAHIDLEQHRGAHPRIGATDVVPFVPLRDVEMAECVVLAQELGRRVGEELGIPVYLYEAAATRPDRVNLADIRHGEYEGLKADDRRQPRSDSRLRAAPSRAGGRDGHRRARVSDRVQRLPDDLRCRDRQEDRQDDPQQLRRSPLRQSARPAGQRQGAGQHESDRLSQDADSCGGRDDPA